MLSHFKNLLVGHFFCKFFAIIAAGLLNIMYIDDTIAEVYASMHHTPAFDTFSRARPRNVFIQISGHTRNCCSVAALGRGRLLAS